MQYEQGVVFRGGKFHKVLNPGWHGRLSGIDIIYTENVKNATICIREVNITTADNKTISIAAKFNYEITDIHKARVLTNDWKSNIVDVGRGIMSKELIKYSWENICAGNVDQLIGSLIEKEADLLGIRIWNFNFTDKLIIRGFKLFNA
jgi:regulator of protease activity HflC (stomatin/prohibitin superfamily)